MAASNAGRGTDVMAPSQVVSHVDRYWRRGPWHFLEDDAREIERTVGLSPWTPVA
jgi:hypothetical protein